MPNILLLVQICLVYPFIKYNFPKSSFVIFQYIWQNILKQKLRKSISRSWENASQTDEQIDRWTDEHDWFNSNPSAKMDISSCFSEIREKNFLKLFGLIVSDMEKTNARKRNTINTVQGSNLRKIIFILFECHRPITKSTDCYFFLLSWKSSW